VAHSRWTTKPTSTPHSANPSRPKIFRVFAFDDRDRAVTAREHVISVALAGGWQMHRDRTPSYDLVFGTKTLTTGAASLTIGTYESDGVHKVSIHLEHRACPKQVCPGT